MWVMQPVHQLKRGGDALRPAHCASLEPHCAAQSCTASILQSLVQLWPVYAIKQLRTTAISVNTNTPAAADNGAVKVYI